MVAFLKGQIEFLARQVDAANLEFDVPHTGAPCEGSGSVDLGWVQLKAHDVARSNGFG